MRVLSSAASSDRRRSRWSALRESPSLLIRAAKRAREDDVTMLAAALAYNAFLALPATLLVVVGLFSLIANPSLVQDTVERLGTVIPDEAATLVEDSLLQLESRTSAGVLMTLVGFALALWTTSGAMGTLMTAVNRAHDLDDSRGFVEKRLVAIVLVAVLGSAVLAVTVLLVFGPHVQGWIGDAVGAESLVGWIWWTAQWPILIAVLFGSFSVAYALATDHPSRQWRILSPGAAFAVVLWLVVSAGFAFYASNFGSYNKTWGSLSAAIVTMVWLWLSSLAILFGAEVNAEAEREAREDELDVGDIVERTGASPLPRAR